jgi:hypothetical protein
MEKIKICSLCLENLPISSFPKDKRMKDGLKKQCRECLKLQRKIRYNIKAYKAIEYYSNGSMKCEICGIDDRDVLCLDHIDNDGSKHRKECKYSSIYSWVETNNYPEGFQVLCRNCNWKKHLENKYKN